MNNTQTGIDVSTWQGDIDWGVVKNNIDFAIIRAGYGKNNIDNKAIQNVKGCEDNGIPFGLYWFSYAYTIEMAQKEAQYLLQFVNGHTPMLPLYFDFEYDSVEYAKKQGAVITNQLLRDMATAFCKELENAGYYAGIYANYDYVKRMYGEDIFNTYDLWYALWDTSEPDRSVNMWQSSNTGKINGISGNVDINISFIDFPALINERGLNGCKSKPKFVCPHSCPYCTHSIKEG